MTKQVRPQTQAKAKHKWHKPTLDSNILSLADFFKELFECAEQTFGPLAYERIDSLLYAKLPPQLKISTNLSYLVNET